MPLLGLSGGPEGPNLVSTAPDWPAWIGLMLTTHFDLVSSPFWVVRFPNPLALGSGLGLQYPYRRVFFLSALPAQKKCKSDMGNGVLIGFVNISGRLMPNHKFFHSLVTMLALDFFPPPDCNF